MPKDVEKKIEVTLQAPMEMRQGVYANFFTIMEGAGETVLDFFFLDAPTGEDVPQEGVMVARVILNPKTFLSLRSSLNKHYEKFIEGEDE